MAEQDGAAPPAPSDTEELLSLTLSRPREALARAREVCAGQPGAYAASVARQAAGIVLRDFGDVSAGIEELRIALRLARQSGSAAREADVLATLGIALVYDGRTAHGIASFDRAVRLSTGVTVGRVLHRRAVVLYTIGQHAAALHDLRRAIAVLRRADDKLWTARALGVRGLVYISMGLTAKADADFRAAGLLWPQTGQVLEAIYTVQNRAEAAAAAGDLPAALAFLDEAEAGYRPLGVVVPDLSIDRCIVLLAAGLACEAFTEADAAVGDIEQIRGRSTKKAELLLVAASCALAAGQPRAALERAELAYRLFRSQRSGWWLAQCGLVLAQARYAAEQPSPRLLREARRAASRLEALGCGDAIQAHLLAGRVALALGNSVADRHLRAAAAGRTRGPALARASGWLSEALRAQAAGDGRRMLTACACGLNVIDQHRHTLGASELRVQATAYGTELAVLAQRYAALAARPRMLLGWSERWRATALAVPAVRPAADAKLKAGLAALRGAARRVDMLRRKDQLTASNQRELAILERERLRLEDVVRARALRARGATGQGRAGVSIRQLLDQLGDAQLIEIVEVDGRLVVLLCAGGKVRQFTAGGSPDAARAADFARFALRRLARDRPAGEVGSALAILRSAGPRLQEALLGPACRYIADRTTVVVPPGKLHAIPWALIPVLGTLPFCVAPSAAAWMRASAARPPNHRYVVLARGPGLASNGAEVPEIARLYDDVTVLGEDMATAEKVLRALDGAWLAHIAAHGTFRADSPLFSALRMHDGPLTVYDFEQLSRAPYRLVLSSCDSGVAAPAGADELLGLVSSLLPLGTAGIVASAVPLNDHAVVPVNRYLHHCLRAGQSMAESLCSTRSGCSDDPVQRAAAISLVALGAA